MPAKQPDRYPLSSTPPPPPPNRLNELPEVRFKFPFISFGKSTMASLTGQSLPVVKSWYTSAGPEQEFQRCFADGLDQSLVSSVMQAGYGLKALVVHPYPNLQLECSSGFLCKSKALVIFVMVFTMHFKVNLALDTSFAHRKNDDLWNIMLSSSM